MVDLVYPLKRGASKLGDTELRLSLRSVEANLRMEIGELWVFGDRPAWLHGAHHVAMEDRLDKALNLREKYRRMTVTAALSDPFVLLDDDHMFLQPADDLPLHTMGELKDLARKYNGSTHGRYLANALVRLVAERMPTVNYQVHYPMLIDKLALRASVAMMGRPMVMGSIYGNLVAGTRAAPRIVAIDRDFRVNTDDDFAAVRDGPFASFPPVLKAAWVAWLEERFPTPSRWETAAAIKAVA